MAEALELDGLLAAARGALDESRVRANPARIEAVAEATQERWRRHRKAWRYALVGALLLFFTPLIIFLGWVLYLRVHPEIYGFATTAEIDALMPAMVYELVPIVLSVSLPGVATMIGAKVAARSDGVRHTAGRGLQWVGTFSLILLISVMAFDYAFGNGTDQVEFILFSVVTTLLGFGGGLCALSLGATREHPDASTGAMSQMPYAGLFRASLILACGDIVVLMVVGVGLMCGLGTPVWGSGLVGGLITVAAAFAMVPCVHALHRLKTWGLMATVGANAFVFVAGVYGVLPVGGAMVFLGFTTAIQLILPVPLVAAIVRGRTVEHPRLTSIGRWLVAHIWTLVAIYCAAAIPLGIVVGLWLDRF